MRFVQHGYSQTRFFEQRGTTMRKAKADFVPCYRVHDRESATLQVSNHAFERVEGLIEGARQSE